MTDVLRDLAPVAALVDRFRLNRILDLGRVPRLGDEQPPIDRGRGMIGDQMCADADLAVSGLAQGLFVNNCQS
ncbi:hypothetical protein FHR32_007170 [Streptosporangium album]|uniref:Uncharacterized protein n=1 Tax=Streptosporangium album TaxID=47479 RepID=A0A7W7WCY7_9ACTN|nr:hypothetical protein [Streptosporangium album]MBB4938183.1 hypothetical protein [Streptosporangium album]MBB4938190.1 hypothetical protein [Streptosporangium album]MBB4941774.1 hypothetical protein [Streptosporangium album]MBB4942770.1 hypothetical protein [Streptosporangium album]